MFALYDTYLPSKKEKAITFVKIFIKEGLLHQDWKAVFKNRKVGGSVSIPRTLSETLTKMNEEFLYNPETLPKKIKDVWIFKDVRILKKAIQWKKEGKIDKLIVGPFICNHPSEYNQITLSKEIDSLVFFSEWHKVMFEHYSSPLKNATIWFSGVDINKWKPSNIVKQKCLIYYKTPNSKLLNVVYNKLNQSNIEPILLKYGSYTPEGYKTALDQAQFCIFISVTETQGVALLESWSMNVPTLVWNSAIWEYQGFKYEKASSCPYLNSKLGLDFKGIKDFEITFDSFLNKINDFTPREIVSNNFKTTDSAERFIKILSET